MFVLHLYSRRSLSFLTSLCGSDSHSELQQRAALTALRCQAVLICTAATGAVHCGLLRANSGLQLGHHRSRTSCFLEGSQSLWYGLQLSAATSSSIRVWLGFNSKPYVGQLAAGWWLPFRALLYTAICALHGDVVVLRSGRLD